MSIVRNLWIKKETYRLKSMIRLFDYILSQYHALYGHDTRQGMIESYKNHLISREYIIRELKELNNDDESNKNGQKRL